MTADCEALGASGLECVDSVCVASSVSPTFACQSTPWPPLSEAGIQASVVARSLTVEQPVAGLQVSACDTLIDPTCSSPRAQAVTNSDGVATLDVVEGFRGHFFVPANEGLNAPYLLHLFPPPDPNVVPSLQGALIITNLQTMRDIGAVGGVDVLPNRGHLFFTAMGCDFQPLPGVVVSVPDAAEEALVAYLGANGLPDQSLTSSSATGIGVAINLEPGFTTVRARHLEAGEIFEQVIYVAPDSITTARIVPSVF